MGITDHKLKENSDTGISESTESPALFRVLLLNDDFTTMDFVVYILETVFRKSPVEAVRIMLNVHKNGIGLAGVFTREIAETTSARVHELARQNQYPLKCTMEKE
ncbi:MAG: ATP-dependent Clp protease adaptor ClpS [Nitrospirota bacterium]|nr:ATP-dependent Clp protease adaptor ClpS [Nitrospirota bacterium]